MGGVTYKMCMGVHKASSGIMGVLEGVYKVHSRYSLSLPQLGLGLAGVDCALRSRRCTSCYLEVHCTYNLLSNCSYNPIISRVTRIVGLIFRL